MTLRIRLLPVLALLLAVATPSWCRWPLPAGGAIVGATPSPGAGTCETNGRINAVACLGGTLYLVAASPRWRG